MGKIEAFYFLLQMFVSYLGMDWMHVRDLLYFHHWSVILKSNNHMKSGILHLYANNQAKLSRLPIRALLQFDFLILSIVRFRNLILVMDSFCPTYIVYES